jgi:Niemann-Pick C1 protein
MGSSVLVGIASTKFIGVIVLAFAPSTLFKLYYFRMYLFIILLGLFNGLMFLPLVLRWVGPEAVSLTSKSNTCLGSQGD